MHVAFVFRFDCDETLAETVSTLNESASWICQERESCWHGDYLNCRPARGVRVRTVDPSSIFLWKSNLRSFGSQVCNSRFLFPVRMPNTVMTQKFGPRSIRSTLTNIRSTIEYLCGNFNASKATAKSQSWTHTDSIVEVAQKKWLY